MDAGCKVLICLSAVLMNKPTTLYMGTCFIAEVCFGSLHLAQCTRTCLHKCVPTLRFPPVFPRQILVVPFVLTTAGSWMKNRRRRTKSWNFLKHVLRFSRTKCQPVPWHLKSPTYQLPRCLRLNPRMGDDNVFLRTILHWERSGRNRWQSHNVCHLLKNWNEEIQKSSWKKAN